MIYWIAISAILLIDYSILLLYYFGGWLRTRTFNLPGGKAPVTKVSVVISARNEAQYIESCIRSLLTQDYPKELYEIIVIDDHSEDDTLKKLESFQGANLRVFKLSEHISRDHVASFKKKAIAVGIKNATGDLIITTDADCTSGRKWLSTVVSYYESYHPKMIAAPVAFAEEKSWLKKWQSLDLCGLMAITAGSIRNHFPNMCNGANLAYERDAFYAVHGFAGIDNQPSGDDVMLMLKMNEKYPGGVHFLKAQDAIVFTQPVETLAELFQQRVRWLSKGTAFPDWKVSLTLVFAWLFNLSIIVNLIGGFFFSDLWTLAAVSFLIKTLVELPILVSGCVFFGKKNLLWQVLPAQVVHILYVVIIGGASRFYKYSWKGRS